jgi:aminoglycoside phosphotransferase (APT) family kinase protein
MSAAPSRDEPEGRLARPRLNAVLTAVCRHAGLDPNDAELIKFTNNAVFRLARQPMVVRIAGSTTMRHRAAKVVQVARWLADHGIPAVRLAPDIEQPLVINGQVATLWQAVPMTGPAPSGTDLGRLLRQLHAIESPPDLPAWNPLDGIRSRLADAEGLDADDQRYLICACDAMDVALADLEYVLPPGIVHGDATVANLIASPSGPVMCDFDSSSVGPREWDLTPVAAGHLRFGNKTDNQALLVATYGFDITTWSGFPTLRRLRELQLVTSVVPVLRSNPQLHQQWAHRLATFRSGDTAAKWALY